MNITIVSSDSSHPVRGYLTKFIKEFCGVHDFNLVESIKHVQGGDMLFLVSCTEIVPEEIFRQYEKSFVLHASDLPKGRGWSPHIWQILEGVSRITLSMIEVSKNVDFGRVWFKQNLLIPRHAIWNEINDILFSAEIDLIRYAVENFELLENEEQDQTISPTFYRKRTPNDSELDISKSIEEQFDLLRVCDPIRYPAYFEIRGHRYTLKLEKYYK